RPRVQQAGEEVSFRELAQLTHVIAVLIREPADQRAARAVRDGADDRSHRRHVLRRNPRRQRDRDHVETGGQEPTADAGPDAACERDHRDRDVVEVADPETGHLEDHKADEDAQVQGDRGQDQKRPWKGRSRHSDHTLRRGRRRRVPRSSDRRIGSRMLMVETDVLGTGRAAGEETPAPDVSLVVTLYNEVDSLPELYRRTVATLDPGPHSYELIFVDDGSTDGTFAALERLHEEDPRVRAVRFKRNFGQHPAMHAGLSRA